MSQRLLAVSFTFLMLASGLPVGEATHTNPLVPDLPTLPQARPTQSCIPSDITPEVLSRANDALAGDPAWYQDELGVPSLCLNGGPVPQYVALIQTLNNELQRLRNTTKEVQDQVDLRLEATLPEGALPEDLVEPKVVLLNETFDGRRTTGFGDWKVVTQRGEDALWTQRTSQTLNGTRTVYGFGDETGYAQGAHQWLVSPEIDLTAVKANKTAIQDLVAARDLARSQMETLCYRGIPPTVPAIAPCQRGNPQGNVNTPPGSPFVAEVPHLSIILDAYEMAFDATIMDAPVMQHAAFLDLTYRYNLANGTDGVRFWIYSGSSQPDRSVLFDEDFARAAVGQSCARDPAGPYVPVEGRNAVNSTGDRHGPNEGDAIGPYTCTSTLAGGQVVRTFPQMRTAATFKDAADPFNQTAFTGETHDWVTARLNLTDWSEERIWILLEMKTNGNDRGQDTFQDPGSFHRFRDYGFEISRVYVQGDGYHRNLRVKDIAASYPPVVAGNENGDDPRRVRTTLPPGNAPIVAYVHNAGDYTENATFVLNAVAGSAFAGSYREQLTMLPDEVRTLRIPWSAVLNGNALVEDRLYRLNATLVLPGTNVTVDGAVDGLPNELPPAADPNATVVRPVNAAGTIPGAGSITLGQLVRADTVRNLTPVRLDGEFGVPLQYCSAVTGRTCDESYAAPKGEQRIALLGVRNDGNTAQDIVADLHVELDGVAKPDIIAEGVRQTLRDVLPGETRAVTWTLTPIEPGAYRTAVALFRSDGKPEPLVERRFYAQRSTGIMCLDTIELRECGPVWAGGFEPALGDENITAAALASDGTLYVATQIAEPHPETGVQSGRLATRSPAGEWRDIANITGSVLNSTFGSGPWPERGWGSIRSIVVQPDGTLYLAGDNATVLRRDVDGTLTALYAPESLFVDYYANYTALVFNETSKQNESVVIENRIQYVPDLSSALWHDGTLHVAGEYGRLMVLEGDALVHTPLTVRNATWSAPVVTETYKGDIHALVAAPNGHALLLGELGLLLRNVPGTGTWNETTVSGNVTSWALAGRDLHAAQAYDGRLYVAGQDALLVSDGTTFAAFTNATLPAPRQNLTQNFTKVSPRGGLTVYTDMLVSEKGGLFIMDYEGRVASCDVCTGVLTQWQYPELALPTLFEKGPTRPARPTLAVSGEAQAFLLGEGGLVLTPEESGVYPNREGWTTTPFLAARDGGVIETATLGPSPTGARQSFLGLPDSAGQRLANDATKFRLQLNHSIRNATIASPVEVHLVYVNYPSHQLAGGAATHTCGPMTQQGTSTSAVCNAERVRRLVDAYTSPTASAGWEPRIYDNLAGASAATGAPAGTQGQAVAAFYAVEFFAEAGARWAIDDLHLQGFVGGKWQTIVEWRGKDSLLNRGTFWTADPEHTVGGALMTLGQDPGPAAQLRALGSIVGQAPQWTITPDAPFEIDSVSPWHLSLEYADRPVFAASSEAFIPTANDTCCATGNAPRLYSNWNSRLVSPVIDLRDAHDPAVVFDHLYAFRQLLVPAGTGATDKPKIMPGDGGYVEISYLKQGEECGYADPAKTCGWSPFYPVRPDRGYPTRPPPTITVETQAGFEPNRIQPDTAYWGRIAFPDDTGFISAPRRTDEYVQERITLANVTCKATQIAELEKPVPVPQDCVPVNLTGRQIRVGFHLLTYKASGADTQFNATEASGDNLKKRPSFPGEGWYISDFKVLGARKLGIDLVAANLTFRVGYDVDAIGVGPGTKVPVNVTVVNNGTFDALGYTGRLHVDRVLNAALKTMERVDTIPLAQQPVLESGQRVNHTLLWSVPAQPEDAQYVLTFVVDPIGVDRDEDFLDNVAQIGTVAKPVVARTTRAFETQFLVSPENATIDITRYMPMFIDNTGNVPLEGFTVERRITIIGRTVEADARDCAEWREFVTAGRPTAIVDCRVWETDAAAPPGAVTPLTAISDDVSPSADLFWKAPERANYLVSVSASVPIVGNTVLADGLDRRVSAFATYLFDDVEGGVRGESDSGAWAFADGWAPAQPGFRSTDAYAFGDALLGRYPANANSSIVSPTIDLGNARAASVGWFHNYRFEPGFDAGIVEASIDNGTTWTVLPVASDTLARAGYNGSTGFHVQPGSPIHPDGDPERDGVRAFTGDSSLHPANVDGWVFSQIDLTDYANVTERGVAYEAYTSIELQAYNQNFTVGSGDRRVSHPSWCPGDAALFRCWEIENVTQDRVSPLGRGDEGQPNTFWWSGSPSFADDQKRPLQNHLMMFPLEIGAVSTDQVVIAEWWELASRFNEEGVFIEKGRGGVKVPDDLYTAYMYHGGFGAETTRYNLGRPELIDRDGKWYLLRADITDIVRKAQADGRTRIDVGFSYTPVATYADEVEAHMTGDDGWSEEDLAKVDAGDPPSDGTTPADGTDYGASNVFGDRPGFAIDGLSILAQSVVRGLPRGEPVTLLTESTAWESRSVTECGNGDAEPDAPTSSNEWLRGNTGFVSCIDAVLNASQPKPQWVRNEPLIVDEVGRNWALVTELPGQPSGWGVVPVRGPDGEFFLPNGDRAKAFWSGEVPYEPQTANAKLNTHDCTRGKDSVDTPGSLGWPDLVPCPQPGTESRLITPAFDLGRVAGTNAQLSFWHRYAFRQHYDTLDAASLPLASGGAVEYQEYDAQTDTWGEWVQLYDGPIRYTPGPASALDRWPEKGGYSAITGDLTRGQTAVRRFDAPFQDVKVQGYADPVQALYSGTSDWTQAEFDVSHLIGKRVRFGFHVAWSDQVLSQQGLAVLPNPDGDAPAPGVDRGGWWIGDVSLVGNVIVGQPVQLRWRAGTDGNVQDGIWLLDDIAAFGSRYRNNVGLFVDTSPGKFGAYNGTSATIPVTVRNLGDSVRRDLAIEILNTERSVAVNLTAPGASVRYVDDAFVIEGITLGPGQSTTVDLVVLAPRSGPASTKLLMTLKEFSEASEDTPFVAIVDNEVQGLLSRTVGFDVQRDPRALFLGPATVREIAPDVGSAVDFDLTFRNTGYGPARLDLKCKAQTVTGWSDTNHNVNSGETPLVSADHACALVGGDLLIPAQTDMTLTYRVVPSAAGFLRVVVNGSVLGGLPVDPIVTGVAVGVSPLAYEMHFDDARSLRENFTLQSADWEYLRGNQGPGALYIGLPENTTARSSTATYNCFGSICRATTQPIDLHNFSDSNPAFLSFWHMDRLAKFDGARVVARVLEDEQKPTSNTAWSTQCILPAPRSHWEGHIKRIAADASGGTPAGGGGATQTPDENAAWTAIGPAQYPSSSDTTYEEFFVTDNGLWEEQWTLAVIDLSQPCYEAELKDGKRTTARHELLGRTVRFEFEVLGGDPNGGLNRGRGQGIYVDDISIGPLSLEVRPLTPQRASMLDNTTKAFNVLVVNKANAPDVVRLEYDAYNSSAPAGSVEVTSEPIQLAPGESRTITAYVTLPRDPSLLPTDFTVRLLARSLVDPNAAGATLLDLAFGPRQWAELALSAEAPKGLVQEGTETFIALTVENNGLVDSVNTTVRVTDSWANGSVVTDLPLASIAAYATAPEEATRVLEFRWRPEKGSLGPHTLTFELDPDVLGEEYTRDNNVASFTVPVVELLIPDLDVANVSALSLRNALGGAVTPAIDADVARYEITAGELVSFDLKVANDGRAGATNVDVRAFIGALSLPPKTIPYIAPGTEAVVTFNWLAQKGEHEIEFLVRSEQVELTSANNRYPGRGVTILTVKGYEIEVSIPDLSALLAPGTTVEVPFSIRNAGNAGEDLQLVANAPEGMRVSLPREGFFLRAGETYSDNARVVLDDEAVAGEQFISIDAVARENPMKVATGRAAVRVNASYDGSVGTVLASGAPPGIVVPIELVNEGNSLEPWSLTVSLPAGWTTNEPLPAKVVVPAHGRIVHELLVNVPVSTAPGDRAMTVKATMANGETREGRATVTVLPLRAAAIQVSDALPRPDRGALTVPVVVENRGNVQQPFEVLLVDPPAGLELSISPSTFDLAPGAKAVAALVVRPNATVEAGTYAITSYALFDGVTPQTAEGRGNLQSIKVPVVRQDLRVSPLEFSPRAGLDAGDKVSVKVSVTNRGLAELTDLPVHLFVDDVFIQEVMVATLPSGSRADVTFNWTALLGVHTLTAVVDPYADTVDGDRADNAVSALATVGNEDVNGGVAAGRAQTPAPGVFGLIAALAIALLLTRSFGSRRQRR